MIHLKRMCFAVILTIICMPVFCFSSELTPGVYARFETNKGEILATLFFEQTPLTVVNFVGLAQGTLESNRGKGIKFYDGLIFHRVIENFMIQGGDPTGTGSGSPGYRFPDEFVKELTHDGPGVLSMANSGPGTNGSQFFITHKATPWLNNKHTVFGKVIKGQDVVNKIEKGDKIVSLTIIRVGEAAKNFKADAASFKTRMEIIQANIELEKKKTAAKFETEMLLRYPGAKKTDTGLMYVQLIQGTGPTPKAGSTVTVHYEGKLKNGQVFDSSYKRGQPAQFVAGVGKIIKGWDQALVTMKKGEKRTLLIPYWLGYGDRGYPGVIPPKADLIFDVELLDFK